MGFFGTKSKKTAVKETTVKECTRIIQGFFKKAGINPADNRLRQPDTVGWWIGRGSALIYILLNPAAKDPTIRILSPILYLPDDLILPFYRRLLELNMELINCALAVSEDQVMLVSERPIQGLDPEEFETMVHYLSGVADDLDDKLALEFKAPMYARGYEGYT